MSSRKINYTKKAAGKASRPVPGQSLNLLNAGKGRGQGSSKLNPLRDLKQLSTAGQVSVHPISFGKAHTSSNVKASSGSGFSVANLLGKAGSGSVTKLLGGGLLSFGMSSLFSAVSDLFGGSHAAPAPLQEFSLPDSQQQTLYSTSGGLSNTNVSSGSLSQGSHGVYNSRTRSADQAAIVNAVKNALLTSSSLNDVIGEL